MIRCLLMCGAVLALAAAEPVLAGYARLDSHGVPEQVRVALTREHFTELWQAAHPEAPPDTAVVDLATGVPRWNLSASLDPLHLQGTLRLAVAVPGAAWREVTLPIGAGTVAAMGATALGGGAAPVVTWRSRAGAAIAVLPGHSQADLTATVTLPLREEAGDLLAEIPLLGGGALTVVPPPGWDVLSDAATFVVTPAGSTAEAPVNREQITIRLRRSAGVAVADRGVALDQDLRLTLRHDRLDWQASLALRVRGTPTRELTLTLPEQLGLLAVSGQALAGWRQEGRMLHLQWTTPVTGMAPLDLRGVLPRAERSGACAVAVALDGAEHSGGELALLSPDHDRLSITEQPGVERAEPRDASELVRVRWHDASAAPAVHWDGASHNLRLTTVAALVALPQTVRAQVALTLVGYGSTEALRLRLPPPWRISSLEAGLSAQFSGADAERLLVLRRAQVFAAGSTLLFDLDADRAALGSTLTLPALTAVADVASDTPTWLLGDAAGVRCEAATGPANESLPRRFAALLPAGGTWRGVCTGVPPYTVRLGDETPRASVSASHYLVLERDRLRWSARLTFTPTSGALTTVVCTIPSASRLTRVAVSDLGRIEQVGDRLVVHLAAPAVHAVTLDLDLELAVSEATVDAGGLIGDGDPVPGGELLALVEDPELGLIHRTADGLDAAPDIAMPLPAGIDAAQVRLRWRSARQAWRLGLRREDLTAASGLDQLATLVEIASTLTPDGSLRSRATWHVLNRSRTQVRLDLPVGCTLWEARVDGRTVAVRRDDGEAQARWLPVAPLRAGEVARRIELTWHENAVDARAPQPHLPRLDGIKIVDVLWRFAGPAGWTVTLDDGALHAIDPDQAQERRARRVADELARLRAQGTLKDRALERLTANLDLLELELRDHQAINQATNVEVERQLDAIQESRDYNIDVYSQRSGGRKALGFANRTQSWTPQVESPVSTAPTPSLGDGNPPPGQHRDQERALLGLDPLGDAPASLTLVGSGNDLALVLRLTAPRRAWWPSALAALVAMGLLGLGWRWRPGR